VLALLALLLAVVPADARRGRETVWGVLGPIPVYYRANLELDGQWLYGMYEPDQRRITIRAGMPPELTATTLSHEVCHAVLSDMGASLADADEEDRTCEALAIARFLEASGR
jgi:hypothetical protein